MTEDPPAGHTPPTSLTDRVVRSSLWVFIGSVISRAMQAVKMVVLARLLVPEDFGLFGIVTLALAAAETFTQTGFGTALIQRQDNTEDYLNTAWTVQLIRGFALAAALFGAAPLVARFFDEPRVIPLLRALSGMEILRGFTNIGIVYFKKELAFDRQVAYQLISSVVTLVVGVVLAWQLRDVWALVWASLAGQLVTTSLSYVLHPYRPRVRLNRQQAHALFSFGKWMMGNSSVSFLATQADRAILGRLLGANALGTFNVADRIGGLVPTEFMHLTNQVMMPAYAKVQNDKERLARGFLEVFGTAVSVGGPVASLMLLSAPDLVHVILGDGWSSAIIPLQILSVGGFLRSVIGVSTPVFLATGRPNIQFWKSSIRAVVILGAVYPLTTRYGVSGTALAGVLGVVALSPLFFLAVRIANVPLSRLLRAALPGLLLTAAAALGTVPGRLVSGSPLCGFAVQLACAGTLTLAASLVLGRRNLGPLVLVDRYVNNLRPESAILPMGEA